MKPALVFDLNETLLDMSALDPAFRKIVDPKSASERRQQWFQQVLELFLTATVVGEYRSFDKLTDDALRMLMAKGGRDASDEHRATLKEALGAIPPYADVRPGLARLRDAGFTIATLTNSTEKAARALIEHGGLTELFDRILSADTIGCYKPAAEAYEYAATELGVALADIQLVAAHSWDIAGAHAAGCRTAFIARAGKVMSPGAPKPDLQASDVTKLAEQLAPEAPKRGAHPEVRA